MPRKTKAEPTVVTKTLDGIEYRWSDKGLMLRRGNRPFRLWDGDTPSAKVVDLANQLAASWRTI